MPTTSRGYRYPAAGATNAVPTDLGNLASDLDADAGIADTRLDAIESKIDLWRTLNQVCVVSASSAISIAHNTQTNVVFDTDVSDPLGWHDPTTNSDRITIGTGFGGLYVVVANGEFAVATGGTYRMMGITVDGTIVARTTLAQSGTASIPTGTYVTALLTLTAGQIVRAFVKHDQGGNLNLSGSSNILTRLAIARLRI